MKLKKLALMGVMMSSGMLGVASQAHALDIDASTLLADGWVLNLNYWTTNDSPAALQPSYVGTLVGFGGELAEAYKMEYGISGEESGTGAPYYGTTFSGADPNNATISWGGDSYIVCGDCYLVVKDGNAEPDMYVFDISWNGQDPINLSNFWNGPGGAISYVGIYNNYSMDDGGGNIAAIPEPETYAMLLAGLGLVGFAARRKIARTA